MSRRHRRRLFEQQDWVLIYRLTRDATLRQARAMVRERDRWHGSTIAITERGRAMWDALT